MTATQTEAEAYAAAVRELYAQDPVGVMDAYRACYEHAEIWHVQNERERFELCLEQDSQDEPSAWAIQDWRACADCSGHNNALHPDSFIHKIGDEWVCDLCADKREMRAAEAEEKRADWLDDAADYGSCETVRVSLEGFGGNGTLYFMTDFEITGAQARAMFQGIAEAQK